MTMRSALILLSATQLTRASERVESKLRGGRAKGETAATSAEADDKDLATVGVRASFSSMGDACLSCASVVGEAHTAGVPCRAHKTPVGWIAAISPTSWLDCPEQLNATYVSQGDACLACEARANISDSALRVCETHQVEEGFDFNYFNRLERSVGTAAQQCQEQFSAPPVTSVRATSTFSTELDACLACAQGEVMFRAYGDGYVCFSLAEAAGYTSGAFQVHGYVPEQATQCPPSASHVYSSLQDACFACMSQGLMIEWRTLGMHEAFACYTVAVGDAHVYAALPGPTSYVETVCSFHHE